MKKILVVDDDHGIREALGALFTEEGYQVVTAPDGRFVDKVSELAPDLIVLDVMLPGADGRELARQLRTRPETKELPIVMVSARDDYRPSALEAGADLFVPKPFDIGLMLDYVEETLGQA